MTDPIEALVATMRRADIPWREEYRCRFIGGPHDGDFHHLPDTGRVLDPPGGPARVVKVGFDSNRTRPTPMEDVTRRPTWHEQGVYTRGDSVYEVYVDRFPTWQYTWAPAGTAHAPGGVTNIVVWEPTEDYDFTRRIMRPGPPRPRPDRYRIHVDGDLAWPLSDAGDVLRDVHRAGQLDYLCGAPSSAVPGRAR